MTLLEKRDAILDSLRCQMKAKVHWIGVKIPFEKGDTAGTIRVTMMESPETERLLLDIANNIAQALADDGESTCSECGYEDGKHWDTCPNR